MANDLLIGAAVAIGGFFLLDKVHPITGNNLPPGISEITGGTYIPPGQTFANGRVSGAAGTILVKAKRPVLPPGVTPEQSYAMNQPRVRQLVAENKAMHVAQAKALLEANDTGSGFFGNLWNGIKGAVAGIVGGFAVGGPVGAVVGAGVGVTGAVVAENAYIRSQKAERASMVGQSPRNRVTQGGPSGNYQKGARVGTPTMVETERR